MQYFSKHNTGLSVIAGLSRNCLVCIFRWLFVYWVYGNT